MCLNSLKIIFNLIYFINIFIFILKLIVEFLNNIIKILRSDMSKYIDCDMLIIVMVRYDKYMLDDMI